MNKKDEQLINSIYEKLIIFKKKGIKVSKTDIKDLFFKLTKKD